MASIFVFLAAVAVPLFRPASIDEVRTAPASGPAAAARPLKAAIDEHRVMGWVLSEDGHVRVQLLESGEELAGLEVDPGAAVSAIGTSLFDGSLAVGYRDGSIRMGSVDFDDEPIASEGAPPELLALEVGEVLVQGPTLVERPAADILRRLSVEVHLGERLDTGSGSPVVRVDGAFPPRGESFAALHEDGTLALYQVQITQNFLTGEEERSLRRAVLPWSPAPGDSPPRWVKLSGVGTSLYLAWEEGRLLRYDLRDLSRPSLAESLDLVAAEAARLTVLGFLIGETTLVTGDSTGRLAAWFPVEGRCDPSRPVGVDGFQLVCGHELPAAPTAVTAITCSQRTRLLAAGSSDGSISLVHVTSEQLLGRTAAGSRSPLSLAMAPREDGIAAWTEAGLQVWVVDPVHPEADLTSLFRPVWYEGFPGPVHAWQSSSATDAFEPKLGLMPLVFGTLKATLYSMLFGAPLALLAALYTSEFMAGRLRSTIKSVLELMASLPSVVLGFLAGNVIAPWVQGWLPALLVTFAAVPFSLLLGAHLWTLLPEHRAVRWSGAPRAFAMVVAFPAAFAAGALLGPLLERLLFSGDVEAWLDGQSGVATGGWFLLLIPLSALIVGLLKGGLANPALRARSASWSRGRCARASLLHFGLAAAATIALALLGALALNGAGMDPRGGAVGTYVQLNALVVGFVMGFAIVPIIYTLAEDALRSVPSHLREASLGAGATPWQTAVRVVMPTAMSGLFSATMIGLGRAVGETMIVLMAAGNTPIMEWNVFSGFRTLSANLAVELPEAVRDSTHYRTLFLAALLLFGMTFVLNTAAELVRQRFRRRAWQL